MKILKNGSQKWYDICHMWHFLHMTHRSTVYISRLRYSADVSTLSFLPTFRYMTARPCLSSVFERYPEGARWRTGNNYCGPHSVMTMNWMRHLKWQYHSKASSLGRMSPPVIYSSLSIYHHLICFVYLILFRQDLKLQKCPS